MLAGLPRLLRPCVFFIAACLCSDICMARLLPACVPPSLHLLPVYVCVCVCLALPPSLIPPPPGGKATSASAATGVDGADAAAPRRVAAAGGSKLNMVRTSVRPRPEMMGSTLGYSR